MSTRPTIRLALLPQGIVFVVILAFVTVCAVLRNVNLLVVVSGTMSATLAICWRCSRILLANTTAERLHPEQVHAGTPVMIQWQVKNHRTSSLFNLRVDDEVRRHQWSSKTNPPKRVGNKNKATGIMMFEGILPGGSCLSSYRATFPSRGVYRAGPAIVSTQFPLPLVKCWFRSQQFSEIYVAPAAGRLLPGWFSQISQTENCFENRSTRRGANDNEFFAIRNWESGDSLKHIHWRATAKTGAPMVRQFESHSPDAVFVAVDLFCDHRNISNLLGDESEERICETILCLLSTLLQQWRVNREQHLVIGVADQEATTHVTNPDADFGRQLHRRLANANPTANPATTRLVNDCFASFSGSQQLLILSSRPMPDEIANHAQIERIHWLHCRAATVAGMFAADENGTSSGTKRPRRTGDQTLAGNS